MWANGKAKHLCRRSHRVEPRGGHKHSESSISQSRSATWCLVIGSPLPPYCHLATDWTCHTTGWTSSTSTLFSKSDSIRATCHLLVGPYTRHVIFFLYRTDATCHPVSGATSSCLYSTDAMCHPVNGAMSSCLYSVDSTCHPISGAMWHLFLPILPVDLIEQNAITFSYGVRLR